MPRDAAPHVDHPDYADWRITRRALTVAASIAVFMMLVTTWLNSIVWARPDAAWWERTVSLALVAAAVAQAVFCWWRRRQLDLAGPGGAWSPVAQEGFAAPRVRTALLVAGTVVFAMWVLSGGWALTAAFAVLAVVLLVRLVWANRGARG